MPIFASFTNAWSERQGDVILNETSDVTYGEQTRIPHVSQVTVSILSFAGLFTLALTAWSQYKFFHKRSKYHDFYEEGDDVDMQVIGNPMVREIVLE